MSDYSSANLGPIVSREQAGNAVSKALRLFVGRGRRYSVKQLSNATGVKDRVIECAMCAPDSIDYRPLSLDALFSVASFLGSNFTNEWLHLTGQGAFDLPSDDTDPGELAAETSEDSAKVVRMAVDGDITNDCPDELNSTGARLMSNGAQLIQAASRARRQG